MDEGMAPGDAASREEMERWKAAAHQEGMSLHEFIKEGVRLRADFSPYFWKRLKAYSRELNVSPAVVLESMVTAGLSQKEAERMVYDLDIPPLDGGGAAGPGLLKGRELERALMAEAVAREVEEFTREIRDNIGSTANFAKEIQIENIKSGNKDLDEMISRLGDYKDHPRVRRHIEETLHFLREEIARIAGP